MGVRGARSRGATYNSDEDNAGRHGDLHFVPTPPQPIHALLDRYKFAPALADPCCGDGAMLRVFEARGYRAFGCDIRGNSCSETLQCDFLKDAWPIEWPVDIVTNPPVSRAGSPNASSIELSR
jgi:hypothetical protein